MPPRYRLKLSKLDFISPVDVPAQETAKVLLIKRAKKQGVSKVSAFARVAKVSDELGLVFCWAFTSTTPDGTAYHDLQGDAIDQDFVKAAAEFMSGTRAVDEMHDGKQTGHVVFAMPMTPEIAAAYGVISKTIGLMVALKPSADALAKFKSGEYTGVSIAGTGTRETVKAAMFRRTLKQAVLTDEVDGHAHVIDLDDPANGWDMLSTSYQTADGAATGHSHSWVYDETTGAIDIAADSGHTHTVDAVVPAEVLAAAAAQEAEETAELVADPTGIPDEIEDEPSSGKTTITVIAARAPAVKSTPRVVVPQPALTSQERPKMNFAKMLAAVLAMTASQQAYVAKLAPDEVEPFFAKPPHERDAIMKSAAEADPVVFKGEKTGVEVRKSDGELAKKFAEQNEANAVTIAKQAEALATRDTEIEKAEIAVFAKASMGNIPGDDATHAYIVKSIRKGGGDAATIEKAFAAIKGSNALSAGRALAAGAGGIETPVVADPAGPEADLRKCVEKFQADHKIPTYAQALNKALVENAEAQRLYGLVRN